MSTHSVRLRFVGWFHGLLDKARELIAKHLGERQIQSQSSAYPGFWPVASVHDGFGQRQVDDAAVYHAALNEQAGHHGANVSFLNDPVYIAYTQRLAASSHNIIGHQKSPAGIIFDVSSFNQKMAGVQSATSQEKVA